eukprot:5359423-Pleurochrysis_carterae.AAC.1
MQERVASLDAECRCEFHPPFAFDELRPFCSSIQFVRSARVAVSPVQESDQGEPLDGALPPFA